MHAYLVALRGEKKSIAGYEGFWSFRNEQVEVLMDEATFDTYLKAYLMSYGIDTRTYAELLEYASTVNRKTGEIRSSTFLIVKSMRPHGILEVATSSQKFKTGITRLTH